MTGDAISTTTAIAGVAFLVIIVARSWRKRGRRRYGPGLIGASYDLLSEDKRRAIELIVEKRAEEKRPEYPDGNLPDPADVKREPRDQ